MHLENSYFDVSKYFINFLSLSYDADESSDEELVQEYGHVTMQLLELMHLLFSRAMGIQTAWERDTEQLWDTAWCPVLQVGNFCHGAN